MISGDGLIVRLRVTAGLLTRSQLRAIADASSTYGNGLLDLSARGNLQLRGVKEETWDSLIKALSVHGLIDLTSEAESVRNVMISPLAGFDPTALLDITDLIRSLEQHLVATTSLHELPAKFGFLIDDGGAFSISSFPTDISFEAIQYDHQTLFALRLGGADDVALIKPEDLVKTAHAAASYFLSHRREASQKIRRMSDLVAVKEITSLLHDLGFTALIYHPRPRHTRSPIGLQSIGSKSVFGVAAPLGRWTATILADLANFSAHHSIQTVRLTPWRALLLPELSADGAADFASTFGSDLIISPDDPRLAITACAGAPSCLHATVETKKAALSLVPVITTATRTKIRLHMSGCEKGCAHPRPSTFTLVGRDGRFDLVVNGRASDIPHKRGVDLHSASMIINEIIAREAL